jgi:hypothetical protein
MSTRFPGTGIDDNTTLPNPATSDTVANVSHAAQHANANDAIKAIEGKVGTGSSTPVANTILFGTGAGTSAWTQLTSAQLAASLSDETGSGAAVFANTPTLITPKVDTINESTPANGVTIDGLNIKDNALNTNNSVVTANITDASVTAPKMNNSGTWNSSWAWQSWVPTWTNLTIGNAVVTAKYTQVGKTAMGFIKVVLGSTSSVTGAATFSAPATAASQYGTGAYNVIGSGYSEDAGVAASNIAGAFNASTTVISLMTLNAAGTYANLLPISGTVPFSWGTSDFFNFAFMYEVA